MSEKRIEREWLGYRHLVMPEDAPYIQIQECRRAFYAGAEGLMRSIMGMFDAGSEPTDADLAKMDAVQAELNEFAANVKRGKA